MDNDRMFDMPSGTFWSTNRQNKTFDDCVLLAGNGLYRVSCILFSLQTIGRLSIKLDIV